jgi:microcystin-dependent protein
MEIKDIILGFLVLIVLYLVYKTRNLEKTSNQEKLSIEKFETDLISAVNNKYTADVDAIRNLSSVANSILSNRDSFRVPATTTLMNNLVIDGNIVVDGSINFTNKDTVMLEILPKYMVIAWANIDIPLGWAICDGKKYILDARNKAIEDITGQATPDLRGRFILGSGVGAKDMNDEFLTERNIGEVGGEEGHALNIEEMPGHSHDYSQPCTGSKCSTHQGTYWQQNALPYQTYDINNSDNTWGFKNNLLRSAGGLLRPGTGKITDGADKDYPDPAIWDTVPHNNMPPYFVLTYIMKL